VKSYRRLLVSIHDVSPALEAPVRALWDLCQSLGITPALLVVPDWHGEWPLEQYPRFVAWLRACEQAGAEIILHGERHDEVGSPRRWGDEARAFLRTKREGEFLTLTRDAPAAHGARSARCGLSTFAGGFIPRHWRATHAPGCARTGFHWRKRNGDPRASTRHTPPRAGTSLERAHTAARHSLANGRAVAMACLALGSTDSHRLASTGPLASAHRSQSAARATAMDGATESRALSRDMSADIGSVRAEGLRLALFTDTYAPQINGVSRTLTRLVDAVHDRGGVAKVFTVDVGNREELEAHASRTDVGAEAHVARRYRSIPFWAYNSLRLAWPAQANVRRELRAFAPTLVHSATEFGVGLAGRWPHSAGCVCVVYHTSFAAYASIDWGGCRRVAGRIAVTWCWTVS
jgi:hypothetical protein